ncbi:hypothetical protein T492DRAFT_866676 [Pavlovales sp. CCMP2436]|nr:hypothetical protein T492DRAFT_866676 [Pavlovales sp. CCMP2436]
MALRAHGIARALACMGFALVGLALIALGLLGSDSGAGLPGRDAGALLGGDAFSALGREAAWHNVMTKLDGEFDWCVSKATEGSCGVGPVARWCAQVCQANDMDGECLQSLLE